MAEEEPRPEGRTFICTVAFVDLVDYSERTVAQQAAQKNHLNRLIGRCLAEIAEAERMTIDTGDGAALCFFGDPEDALFAAASLRQEVAADPGPERTQIRIGINLGPARMVRDLNGNRNVIGDSINVAARVMSFAAPNQILVTRSYYEVVSHISAEHAQLFQYAGLHRDKHVREHEVYAVHVRPREGALATGDSYEPVDSAALEAPGLTAELLTRVTEALTQHLGPVARLVVRRAALRSRDARHLVATLAESLTGASRDAFLAATSGLATPRPDPRPDAAAAAPEPASGGGRSAPVERAVVSAALLSAAETRLAAVIGPIARVLVAKMAAEVSDPGQLVERLAAHIPDARARAVFRAELARL
jgi:class 3 adenylate cyclase